MDQFKLVRKIGEGAHGTVWKAENKMNNGIFALKKIQLKKLSDRIPITVIREVKTLQQIDNQCVVKLYDVFTDGPGFVLVFEYLISDLSSILSEAVRPLEEAIVKSYMIMLLKGLSYCHKLGIMHRDLKPANLLINEHGQLKIADFGLARIFMDDGSRLYSHQVVTRWYRSPELLYGARIYDKGVDLWAVGCIFGEMLNNSPLFPGENDIEQLCLVLKTLGTPSEDSWPGLKDLPDYNKITFPACKPIPFAELVPDASAIAVNFLKSFLLYDSTLRLDAEKALIEKYFFTKPLPHPCDCLPKPSCKKSKPFFDEVDPTKRLDNTLIPPDLVQQFDHIWDDV